MPSELRTEKGVVVGLNALHREGQSPTNRFEEGHRRASAALVSNVQVQQLY